MKRTLTTVLVTIIVFAVGAGGSNAQIPDEFTNLKLLPEDISKRELVGVMRKFAGALGVRCNHCHVGPEDLKGMDFATDELKTKVTARTMIGMVDAINSDHLAKLDTGRDTTVEIKCESCHRGLVVPRSLTSVLAESFEADGVDAAESLYRELREEYYGGASYDFSDKPLNSLAETIGRAGDTDAALALIHLNIEFHPDSSYTRMLLGGIHVAREENDEAIAAFKKAIELDPTNTWAQRQIDRLEAEED